MQPPDAWNTVDDTLFNPGLRQPAQIVVDCKYNSCGDNLFAFALTWGGTTQRYCDQGEQYCCEGPGYAPLEFSNITILG